MKKIFLSIIRFFSPSNIFFFLRPVEPNKAFQHFPGYEITGILPVIGYGILIVSLGDFLNTLLPLKLQNPAWELQTIGSILNQTWAFLIGIGFIFTRYFRENQEDVRLLDLFLLRSIRWLMFTMGIIYLLLIPLVLLDSNRLLMINNTQVTQEQNTKIAQIAQLENKTNSEFNPSQLRQLGPSLGIDPDNLKSISDTEVRKTIQQKLSVLKNQIKSDSDRTLKSGLKNVWRNGIRTILSQIVAIIIFFFIWSRTGRIGRMI